MGDDSVEMIYSTIAGSITPEEIDTENLAAAIEAPASRSQFHIVADGDELNAMLAQPLAKWRIYLHQSQHALAYHPGYNGPVRVTGGAGTGKTVVAMHRAKALADRLTERSHKQILITTFTRNLVESIKRDLLLLGGSDLLDVVDVVNVDALASQVVREVEGAARGVIQDRDLKPLWETAALDVGVDDHTAEFLIQEWEQVVLAKGIESRDEYFRVARSGRGVRLDRRARAQIWKVIEAATQEMKARGSRTHRQIAAFGAGYMHQKQIKPYRHVIVDEAQDLHEAQWRLLRAAVDEGPDDMFIVGDAHQRIYGNRSSLSSLGIRIVGRSHRLRINYRTTRQILRWSLGLLGEGDYDDLDGGVDDRTTAGYHSHLDGEDPIVIGFPSQQAMVEGLVEQVRGWIDAGVDLNAIAVATRTTRLFKKVESALRGAGMAAYSLRAQTVDRDGVAIGTMHRMKGLEYRRMAVIDLSDDQMPLEVAMTSLADDPLEHEADLRRERCLFYVACTRTREHLWVSWSGTPSRFLPPAPDQ